MEIDSGGILAGLFVTAAFFGGIGFWVATQTGRDTTEGWLLGALGGPFGIVIALLLPRKK